MPYTSFYQGTVPQLPDNAIFLSGVAGESQRLDLGGQGGGGGAAGTSMHL